MKKNTILIVVLAIFVVVIGGLFYVSSSKTPSASSAQKSEVLASNYITYTPAAFADAKNEGRTLLFFWAPWCGTCSFLDDEIKKRNSELPQDLTILRTNYDTETDLKNKYGIVFQHTLVQVNKDGSEVKKWIGGGVDLLKQQIK